MKESLAKFKCSSKRWALYEFDITQESYECIPNLDGKPINAYYSAFNDYRELISLSRFKFEIRKQMNALADYAKGRHDICIYICLYIYI